MLDTLAREQYDRPATVTNRFAQLRRRLVRTDPTPGSGSPELPAEGAPQTDAGGKERALIAALRAGDEAAFVLLVERYNSSLQRLAQLHVGDPVVAEEVVQEAWLGVLRGIDRFEGRSSLQTWLFRILTNCAKRRGERERRTIAFSTLMDDDDGGSERAVHSDRFQASGAWLTPPQSWAGQPEQQLLAGETRNIVATAVAALPPAQQRVLLLRDVEGCAAADVCSLLAISEANQRVLLHRARTRVRLALARYLQEE